MMKCQVYFTFLRKSVLMGMEKMKKGCASDEKNQIEAQRSGFDVERRSSGVSAL